SQSNPTVFFSNSSSGNALMAFAKTQPREHNDLWRRKSHLHLLVEAVEILVLALILCHQLIEKKLLILLPNTWYSWQRNTRRLAPLANPSSSCFDHRLN